MSEYSRLYDELIPLNYNYLYDRSSRNIMYVGFSIRWNFLKLIRDPQQKYEFLDIKNVVIFSLIFLQFMQSYEKENLKILFILGINSAK